MKKFLFLLAVLAFGSLAPVASATPAEPAAITIPIDPALAPAEQKAVRSYILSSMRASAEAMLAQTETATPTVRQMLQTSLMASSNISLDGLPENYKAYVQESRKLGQEAIGNIQGLDKTMDQMTPEDIKQMEASMESIVASSQALEARYPEVARYLGTQALSDLSQQLTIQSGIQKKVVAHLIEHVEELQGDQARMTQMALKLTFQLLLEEIDKLSAE